MPRLMVAAGDKRKIPDYHRLHIGRNLNGKSIQECMAFFKSLLKPGWAWQDTEVSISVQDGEVLMDTFSFTTWTQEDIDMHNAEREAEESASRTEAYWNEVDDLKALLIKHPEVGRKMMKEYFGIPK